MMKNITILCNTPYQLIVATYLKRVVFLNDKVCLLISDKINGYQQLIDNLKNTEQFESVLPVSKDFFSRIENSKLGRVMFHLGKSFFSHFLLRQCMPEIPDACDVFLCANIEFLCVAFCRAYGCHLELFEDGIASYSMELGDFYEAVFHGCDRKRRRRYACYVNAGRIYLFCPERLRWNPPFPVERLESFARDRQFVQVLNRIFGYDSLKEPYSEDYIFFEEAYNSDGRKVDDIGIVSEIAKAVGKEHILVKRHPRSAEDRFGAMGFHTNSNSSVPWEVVALNMCLKEKTILTIASAAAITPYLLLGMHMNAILLYKLFSDAPLKRDVLEVLEEICEENPDCLVPDSREQLIDILKNAREN